MNEKMDDKREEIMENEMQRTNKECKSVNEDGNIQKIDKKPKNDEMGIENTITNFTNYFEAKKTNENFGAIFVPLKTKIKEKQQIENDICEINDKVKFYDLIDLLDENTIKMESVSYSLLKNVYEELQNALAFFINHNLNDEYVQKSKMQSFEIKNVILRRIYDSLHFDSTTLLKDNDAMSLVTILDDEMQKKVKIRYLKIRKQILAAKNDIFVHKFEFLIVQAIKQELQLYFRMFVNDLEMFVNELENETVDVMQNETLFSMCTYSLLRQILENMEIGRIKLIESEYNAKCDKEKLKFTVKNDELAKRIDTIDLYLAYKVCIKCIQIYLNGKEDNQITNEIFEL
ncbi:hypothetical protein BDAP_002870 [Binucleata daphniae]